jgi:anti-anti-sigma factor
VGVSTISHSARFASHFLNRNPVASKSNSPLQASGEWNVTQLNLLVEVITEPTGVVVMLKGDADIAGAEVMERKLLAIAAQRPAKLIIDLRGLGLISSIAMGVLMQLRRGVHQHGGQLCLAGASGNVLDALKRAQLDRVFTLLPSTADARRSS